jgi:hypothetical protein
MCCGSSRAKIPTGAHRLTRALAPPPQPRGPTASPPAKPVFEYAGATALTIVSPVTRKTYRFDKPGARLEVDPRDRSWVAFVPNVVRIGG